ncbi:MAG: hypothetical protein VKK59_02065 [Vampirovibrionales bacterium]|nr:hypothetical protein [Vampirovibrionales bacterium]
MALLLLLGAALRVNHLNDKSLWLDEFYAIAHATGHLIDPSALAYRHQPVTPEAPKIASFYVDQSFAMPDGFQPEKTLAVLKTNVHTPLFFMALSGWMHLGQALGVNPLSPGWLRIPSLGFGLLAILLMGLIAWQLSRGRLHRGAITFTAAAMMTLSGYFVYHSQNARPYTMLICWALLAVLGLLQAQHRPKQGVTLMTASLIAALYTSYWAAPFVLWILGFAWFTQVVPRFWLVVSSAVLGLAFAPWLPILMQQRAFTHISGHYTDGLFNPVQLPEQLWRTLCSFVMIKASWFRIVMLVLAFAMAGCGWIKQKVDGFTMRQWPLWLKLCASWLMSLLVSHILADIMGQSHTATIQRYLVLAAPPWLLLIAFGLWQTPWEVILYRLRPSTFFKRWGSGILVGLLLTAMFTSAWRVSEGKAFKSEAFKDMAGILKTEGHPGEDLVLIHKPGAPVAGLAYYLGNVSAAAGTNTASQLLLRSFNEKTPLAQDSLAAVMIWLDHHPEIQRLWWVQTHSGDVIYQSVQPVLLAHHFESVTPINTHLEGFRFQRFERKKHR